MNSPSFILHAVKLNPGKPCSDLAEKDIAATLKSKTLAWVHLDINSHKARPWVEENLPFLDPLIVDALFEKETRPRVEEFEDGLLVNLRAVNLNEGAKAHDMISVRLWIDDRKIISIRRRKIFALQDILEKLRVGGGPDSSGGFLAQMALNLVDRMEPIVGKLDEATDTLEETILDSPDFKMRKQIISLRQQAIVLRRFIAPQREVVAKLRHIEKAWIGKREKLAFQEAYDHLYRFIEDLDSIRERLQVVQDELTNYLSDQLNKRMYILSIVAAIFLPLGFLTGLLGINVAGIWGAEYPNAFSVFLGILGVIVVLMAIFFKTRKWF